MIQRKVLLFFLIALLSLSFKAQILNENPSRQLQNCQPGCLTCSSSEVCSDCDANRVLEDGKCRCESPRVLRGNDCECPWYMSENSSTHVCEYIDLIDVAYHPQVSPLFDAILQAQVNPRLKWTTPPTFTWTVECNYQNTATQGQIDTYLSTQQSDLLRIPSSFLEHNLECQVKVSYNNQNNVEISKEINFKKFSYFQPQVQIVGGPFQMFNHAQTNVILAEVVSLTGSPIFPSDLKITWTQVDGKNRLDVTEFSSSSNPLRLTVPRCTLSQGKLYTFRIDVQIGLNPVITSQQVTIGVHAPKINLKPIETDTYHIYTKDLKLTASQFSVEDECNQEIESSDLLDLSTVKYTWECAIVDLSYSDRRRLLVSESTEITEDANIITHPDPQHLFYRSAASKTLTIPSSYFIQYQGYQLIFYLTVTAQGKTSIPSLTSFNLLQSTLHVIQTKAYVQLLDSKPFTNVNFSCTNENNCQTFGSLTQFIGSNYNPKYTYTWIFHAFSAFETHESYRNWLTIYVVGTIPRVVPQIILQVTDGTNVASSFFTLPVSTPLQRGSIYIYPSSGEAYKTNFFLSTYLNKDDDLPISFQFYTGCLVANNEMTTKYEPYDYTPIILPPNWGGCHVGVSMTDSLGYSMSVSIGVTLTGRSSSLAEALERNFLAMDSTRSSSNLYQRMRLISVILENLQAFETSDPDESLSVTSSQLKYSMIAELRDIFLALGPDDSTLKEIVLRNIMYATEQLFNEDRNWELYMSIMDNYYQASSPKSILASEEHRSFATILDNLIYYMKKPESSFADPEKIFTYSNTLIRSTLDGLIPSNTNGFNYGNGNFFSLFTIRTTYCKVLEEKIEVPYWYGISVNLTLKHEINLSPEECDNQADFIFLAFRPNYTVAGWGEFRNVLALDIRDSFTGKSILNLYNYFLYSPSDFCPLFAGYCNPDSDGGTTIYGIFDIKDQIYKIFGKSKIDQIVNISALSDFKFWQSVAFWTVIGFSIWFLISFYWLYIKHPTYCGLTASKTISQKPLYKKTNFFFWLVHPLIGIYLYNDPKSTKATRIALYYQRLVVVMVFSTIFSSISKGEGAVFRAYIILFNVCTVIPINSLLNRIFGWAFKLKISKKKFVSTLKQSLAIFLYLGFLIACFIVIFIIEAQQDQSQNKTWAINFAISFLQDLTLSPLINFIIKVLIVKFSLSEKTTKLKRTQTSITFLLQNFKSIYISIFGTTSTPNDTQPPTPTEIASPLSTSRKLLKLSTLDSASPTLPKSPAKRAFRTRRVSDTEMGNVDSIAAETLVTDRFQTIFSEGKTEQVKPLSPVKKNYERMQSANIASAQFASSSKLASSRDFNTNGERKFVNRTSLILSPSDPLPEQIEIEFEDGLFSPDESPQGTQTSIPKLRKDRKGFGTALFSTQEKMETIKEGKPFGTAVFSTLEKIKDERSLGSSLFLTQEKIKRPPPERCQTVI